MHESDVAYESAPVAFGQRASALALAFYGVVEKMPPADQHFVLAALVQRFPFEVGNENRAAVLAPVRDYCLQSLAAGTPPSKKGYTKWRSEQLKTRECPDPRTVVRTLGSWSEAVSAATDGLAPDVRSTRLVSAPRFTKERLVETVLEFAEEQPTGRLTLTGYRAWCRTKADANGGAGRYPISLGPITRIGGWPALLNELGLADRVVRPSTYREHIGRREFSDEDCLHWLREAAAEIPGALTRLKYARWRAERSNADGVRIPSNELVLRRFGNWNAAKEQAGLEVPKKHTAGSRSTHPYTASEMVEALRSAHTDSGADVPERGYDVWRDQALRRMRGADPTSELRLPTATTIKNHLGEGSWVLAREKALADA